MKTKECIVYDFDGTLYDGDSFIDFFIFSIKKYPITVITLILLPVYVLLWKIKAIDDKKLKEQFLVFLKNKTPDFRENLVSDFWKSKKYKLFSWIDDELKRDKETGLDLICISASPDFLLLNFVKNLGFNKVICSDFYNETKKLHLMKSKNCKGDEKVSRLNAWGAKNKVIFSVKKMVSDSFVDMPLFKLAEKCYFVKDKKMEFLEV